MSKPMLLTKPTAFGYDEESGTVRAGGEAGSETVVGTKSLMKMIRTVVEESMVSVLQTISDAILVMKDGFVSSAEKLTYELSRLVDATGGYTASVESIGDSNGALGGVNYHRIAALLANILRDAPVQTKVEVYMDDGDVYLDKERVGRSVAPVVSRVIVQGK